MGSATSGVEVRIVREVDLSGVLSRELRGFWEEVLLLAHADVSQPGRAPFKTGNLRDSLAPGAGTSMVDRSSMPMFALYGTNTAYGGKLEREPGYRYRGGPSKGKPTKGWLSSTVQRIAPSVDSALEDLARRVEGGWGG